MSGRAAIQQQRAMPRMMLLLFVSTVAGPEFIRLAVFDEFFWWFVMSALKILIAIEMFYMLVEILLQFHEDVSLIFHLICELLSNHITFCYFYVWWLFPS